MSPIPEPILPTVAIPWQTSAGDPYDRSYSGDPGTAYARYVASTGSSVLNILYQGTQATGFWAAGSPLHATLTGAFLFEFFYGTLALAALQLIWDPEDYWKEEDAILGFHGVMQAGSTSDLERAHNVKATEMNVYEHMMIGTAV